MQRFRSFLVLSGLSLLSLCAHADTTFNISFSSVNYSGTATVTATPDPYTSGAYDITGGTAMINGAPASLVLPSGDSQNFNRSHHVKYDNVLFPDTPQLDDYGLDFFTGTVYINPYYDSGQYFVYAFSPEDGADLQGDASFSAVQVGSTPEPGSLVLLSTGLLGVTGMVRRRLRTA